MKKFFVPLCAYILFTAAIAISQDAAAPEDESLDPTAYEVVGPEKLNTSGTKTLTIQYTPVTNEARFIYTCPTTLFDAYEASSEIKARLATFVREKKCYFYTYTRKDETKFDNVNQKANYTAFVQLVRE